MTTPSFLSMRPLLHALLSLSMLAFAPTADAAPQALKPRELIAKPSGRELAAETYVERIVVKFHEGSRVRLRDQRLVALAAERDAAERALLAGRGLGDERLQGDVMQVERLLERAPRASGVARLFDEPETALEARKASGERRGGQQLADLNLYFEVPLLPGTTSGRVADLVAALNGLDGVEVAYAEPPPEPAMVDFGMDAALRSLLAASDIPPNTPLLEVNQRYLDAAPDGIGARSAWTVPGGQGQNVKVVDVEGGWRTSHEDMPNLFHMGGTQYADIGWRNHGTAVLGEIVGAANAYGVTGIAHQAQAGYESVGAQSAASAISRAAAAAGTGGIVLIELHAQGPSDGTPCTCNTSQCNYIAMEYWQANYDAIKTATANGVIVVEAAGNGSANLDASAYGGRFNRSLWDSEAIIVGGSTAYTRMPMCWTNFGSRVDVHAWGERVYTLGYGDAFGASYGEDQYYTSSFSGTSSASPIVVGAAASAQGVALANGRRLTSAQMRALLRGTGTPQGTDARQIGPLPNLGEALPRVIAGDY